MNIDEYLKSFPSAQRQPVCPHDWTAWPVTKLLVAWYRRVDKVEFWAGVVVVGYYMAHCVSEVP